MREFRIAIPQVQTNASEIGNIAFRLTGYAEDIRTISGNLPLSSHAMEQVKQNLRQQIQTLLEQSNSTESFRSGLEEICRTYLNTETLLAGQIKENCTGIPGEISEQEGWDSLNQILDFLTGSEFSFLTGVISGIVEVLKNLEGLGDITGLGSYLLGLGNDLFQDMQDGATANSLLATLITDTLVFMVGFMIGKTTSGAIKTALSGLGTTICPGLGTAAGATIGAIIGEIGGAAVSYVYEEIIVNADWDNDGKSNKTEFSEGLEGILDWLNPAGDDYTITVSAS